MPNTLHALDAFILATYLAALAGVGVYFSRRQTSLDDFFLARQSMAWLPVGLSLMAALDSAIDYLMQPSATIRYGLVSSSAPRRDCCCIRGFRAWQRSCSADWGRCWR